MFVGAAEQSVVFRSRYAAHFESNVRGVVRGVGNCRESSGLKGIDRVSLRSVTYVSGINCNLCRRNGINAPNSGVTE